MVRTVAQRSRFRASFMGGTAGLVALVGLVSSACALDVTLENLTIPLGERTILRMDRVEVTGTNLTQEELTKLFSAGTSAEDRRSLAVKLRAERIAIPQIVFSDGESGIIASGLFANAIAEGKVGSAGFAGMDGSLKPKDGDLLTVKSGPLKLEGADVSDVLAGNIHGLRLSRNAWEDIAVAVPDKGVTVKIASITGQAAYEGSIPVKWAGSFKGLVIQPAPNSDIARQLSSAGFDKFEFELAIANTYDPATGTYVLDDLTYRGTEIGELTLKGRLGRLEKGLWSGLEDQMKTALLQGKFTAAELSYRDLGLIEKIINFQAKQQQKEPAALRAEVQAMARLFVPALMAGAPNASTAADAIARFIANPTTLTVTLRPKAGEIGIAELAQTDKLAAFLEKIELDVRTNSPAQ